MEKNKSIILEEIQQIKNSLLEALEQNLKELYTKQSDFFAVIRRKISELKSKIEESKEIILAKLKNIENLESLSIEKLESVKKELNQLKLPNISFKLEVTIEEDKGKPVFLLYGSKLLEIDLVYDRISHHDLESRNILVNFLDSSILTHKRTIFIHSGRLFKSFLYKLQGDRLVVQTMTETKDGSYSLVYINRRLILVSLNNENSSKDSRNTSVFIYRTSLSLIKEFSLEIKNARTAAALNSKIFVADSNTVWEIKHDKRSGELKVLQTYEFEFRIFMIIPVSELILVVDQKSYEMKPFETIDTKILEIEDDFPIMTISEKSCFYITGFNLKIIDFESQTLKRYRISDYI